MNTKLLKCDLKVCITYVCNVQVIPIALLLFAAPNMKGNHILINIFSNLYK